jgi:hypothetical protein
MVGDYVCSFEIGFQKASPDHFYVHELGIVYFSKIMHICCYGIFVIVLVAFDVRCDQFM